MTQSENVRKEVILLKASSEVLTEGETLLEKSKAIGKEIEERTTSVLEMKDSTSKRRELARHPALDQAF